jgi:fused signal recognition particle receptor
MDLTLVIILGVVILAAIGFFVVRKPKELPAAPDSEQGKPAAKIEAKAEPKALPKAETPKTSAKDEGAKPATSPRAPGVEPVAKPKEVPPSKVPSDLLSSDVLKAEESVPPPALSKEDGLPAPSVPRVSKREIAGMRAGLAASRTGFIARLTSLFAGRKEIDPAIFEQIEEVMLSSDVGVKTTQAILERLREGLAKNELRDADAVWAALRAEATRLLTVPGVRGGRLQGKGKPVVVLMVGVNGVGKTTTIGKLATRYAAEGRKVVLAAGDTFRAAAVQQLEVWGKRVGAEVIRGKDGGDPGAVAFDATTRAREAGADLLLIDTAGRLHTKAPLMDEIKKVSKSVAKAFDGAPHETLLVVDATTGNNALTQAAMFKEAIDLTGIILTKLDGTAKGGIVLAICDELKVPVRYIGLGERAEDLREFHAEDFVEALFGRESDEAAAA